MGRRISPYFAMGTLATCPLLKVELHRMPHPGERRCKVLGRSMCVKHTPFGARCGALQYSGASGRNGAFIYGGRGGKSPDARVCTDTHAHPHPHIMPVPTQLKPS